MVSVKLKVIKRVGEGYTDLGHSAEWQCEQYGYQYYDHNAALATDSFGPLWDKQQFYEIPDALAYTLFPEATR